MSETAVLDATRAPAISGSSVSNKASGKAASSILAVSCPDTTGVVAAVASFLAANHCLITEAQHFDDPFTNTSFMRTVFHDNGEGAPTLSHLDSMFGTAVA